MIQKTLKWFVDYVYLSHLVCTWFRFILIACVETSRQTRVPVASIVEFHQYVTVKCGIYAVVLSPEGSSVELEMRPPKRLLLLWINHGVVLDNINIFHLVQGKK